MADDLREQLTRISVKSQMLIQRYENVLAVKEQLEKELERMREEITRQTLKIEQLEQQLEFMTVSAALAPDKAALESARRTISDIIRDINRCITDLEN